MAEGAKITPADLEMEVPCGRYDGTGLKDARELLGKEPLAKTLSHNRDNLTKVAQELGISCPTLHDPMEKYGMPKD